MPATSLCQIINFSQVQQVIHAFYEKLQFHPKLGHYFKHIPDFTEHEYRISCFWWLSMGGKLTAPPHIDMINKHMPLGISKDDLLIWLSLFEETLNQQLTSEPALLWIEKARQIAERLLKIVILQQTPGIQITEAKDSGTEK